MLQHCWKLVFLHFSNTNGRIIDNQLLYRSFLKMHETFLTTGYAAGQVDNS